jgi:hypothetical protein
MLRMAMRWRSWRNKYRHHVILAKARTHTMHALWRTSIAIVLTGYWPRAGEADTFSGNK